MKKLSINNAIKFSRVAEKVIKLLFDVSDVSIEISVDAQDLDKLSR